MQNLWVNREKCIEMAGVLKTFSIHPEFLNRPFLRKPMDNELRLRMLIFSVAICHQTHFFKSNAQQLAGWEYMEHAFLGMARENPSFLDPLFVRKKTTGEMDETLLSLFSNDGNPRNSTLDRLEERVELYRNTAEFISEDYSGKMNELLEESGGYLMKNGKGLYEILERMKAFADPLRKKSTFFIKLAIDSGLLKIKDKQNLVPIMDYHMQRVLLRNGCVEIPDANLRRKLQLRKPLDSDEPIRSLCVEALKIIARFSGFSILTMNDIYWPLGRSCCYEACLCEHKTCEKHPCTLTKSLFLSRHDHCIFEENCNGSHDPEYRYLWHPLVETHFY